MRRLLTLLLVPGLAVADSASDLYEKAVEMSRCYGTQRAFANYIQAAMPMSARAEEASETAADTRLASLALFNSAGLSNQKAEDAIERYSHQPRVELASQIDATKHDPQAFVEAIEPLCQCNAKMDSQRGTIDALLEEGYR